MVGLSEIDWDPAEAARAFKRLDDPGPVDDTKLFGSFEPYIIPITMDVGEDYRWERGFRPVYPGPERRRHMRDQALRTLQISCAKLGYLPPSRRSPFPDLTHEAQVRHLKQWYAENKDKFTEAEKPAPKPPTGRE
jgi:hypothetical protein